MVKTLCIGVTALACLAIAIAADAADLSMTPIYKARPSAAAAPGGSVKDQSRPAGALAGERFKLSTSADAITPAVVPPSGQILSGHVFWTGLYDRF